MATTIQIKRSASAGAAPTLAYGEIAYSFHSTGEKLWIGDNSSGSHVLGGKYYTDKFPATFGTSAATTLVSTDANGDVGMNSGDVTAIGDLQSTTAKIGASQELELSAGQVATKSGSNLTIDGTGNNLILKGALSIPGANATVKNPTDNTLGTSQTHLITENAVKNYVDTQISNSGDISSTNSSLTITDSTLTADVGANATAMVLSETDVKFKGADFDLELNSSQTGSLDADGASDTTITHRDNAGKAFARIKASHDGASSDSRGKLILQTQPLHTAANDTTLQNVMTLDSNKKVTIHGDLQVDGTQYEINSTTISIDDPVLTLGGDYGTIDGISSSHSGTSWTDGETNIVEPHSTGTGSGTGAQFKVVVSGSTHTVTIHEGGIGYKDSDNAIILKDPDTSGGDITVDVTSVTERASTDDSKDRGIHYHYGDGSNAKQGFFGMLNAGSDKGKFTFIPTLTGATNNSYSGSAGTIKATFEGDITGDVTGNVSGTAATVTGATQASITSAANLVTVGTLTAGGINAASAFTINTGTGNITSAGKLHLAAEAGSGGDGSLTFGATGGSADAEIYFDATDFNINSGGDLLLKTDSLKVTSDSTAAGEGISFYHDLASANPSFSMGTAAAESFNIETTFAGTGNKQLTTVTFNSKSASTSDNYGKFVFAVDETSIFEVNDGGLTGSLANNGANLDGFTVNGGTFS